MILFFTFYIVLPLVTNFCTIYLRVFPWVPVTSPWINESACLWQYGHTYFWQLRKSLKMVFLSFGSRPSSHYQPKGPKLENQSRRPYLNPAPTIYIISPYSWSLFQWTITQNLYLYVIVLATNFIRLNFPLFFRLNIRIKHRIREKIRGIYIEKGIYIINWNVLVL